jgi:hypothetical protein
MEQGWRRAEPSRVSQALTRVFAFGASFAGVWEMLWNLKLSEPGSKSESVGMTYLYRLLSESCI